MVITEYRVQVEERETTDEDRIEFEQRRVTDDPPAASAAVVDRPRDTLGHCWDGLPCDHPDHGAYGTIHFMR